MLPSSNILAFTLAAFLLIVIPGPSVLFVIGRSLALGRTGGLLSVLGNALGMIPQIGAVALGVGAIVTQSIVVYTIIKFAGAGYLIYLGIQAIRHRKRVALATHPATARPTHRLLIEGFIVGATNPKSIVFFVAVLPQFVVPDAGAVPLQLLTLGAIFLVIALVFDSVWVLIAATSREWFAKSPRRISSMSATGGVMMIGLGGTLALAGSNP